MLGFDDLGHLLRLSAMTADYIDRAQPIDMQLFTP
jgi:hypothetical protein